VNATKLLGGYIPSIHLRFVITDFKWHKK